MTTTALAVWAPVVRFNDRPGPEIRYRPPTSTVDPRYAACTSHRVACDCREAHMAEDRGEMRSYSDENNRLEQAINAALALHAGPTPTGKCSDPNCFGTYPCPTRNLLAPLSWRERYKSREI